MGKKKVPAWLSRLIHTSGNSRVIPGDLLGVHVETVPRVMVTKNLWYTDLLLAYSWFFFQDSLHVVSTNNPTTRMRFCQIEGENARRNFTVLDMYYSRWDWLFWISECFVNVYSYCFVLFLNSNLSTNLRKYYALFVPFWQFGSLLWSWIVGKGIW